MPELPDGVSLANIRSGYAAVQVDGVQVGYVKRPVDGGPWAPVVGENVEHGTSGRRIKGRHGAVWCDTRSEAVDVVLQAHRGTW